VGRVSDEQIVQMIADIEEEDARAKTFGEAHGNYGEDFGAIVFDLRDCREALALAEAREAGLRGLVKKLNDAVVNAQLAIAERECQSCADVHEALMEAAQPLHDPCAALADDGSRAVAVLRAAEALEEVYSSELQHPQITAVSWMRFCDALAAWKGGART